MRTPKAASELDPCWKERQLTYKCLDENNYDNEKCQAFITNGKYCKKFWLAIAMERKKQGIKPDVPIGEEREKIRQEFLKSHPKPKVQVTIE